MDNNHPLPESNTLSFSFPKQLRLLDKTAYSAVFNDAPIRASHPNFLILSRPNGLAHPRLGLVVAKKNVRHAHERNTIKRISRECFRLQQHKLPPIDAIVLARRGADELSPNELSKIFNGLWHRIIKRAQKTL